MAENIKNLGKVCITPEGAWDANKNYERLALVTGIEPDPLDPTVEHLMSYISRQNVPPGIKLNNELYWQKFTNVVKFEDLYVGEDGWLYIGDVPIYQITLNDVLGDIVVDKIEQGLTEKIMQAITTYMGGVVSDFVTAITGQISRLINSGIEIRNKVSGGMTNHNVDEITHYGNVNLNHNGRVEEVLSGDVGVNLKVSGQIYVDGDEPTPTPKYLVTINTNPSDAIVTLNGIQGNSGEFEEGSTVSVVVSKSGYVTKNESITNLQQDTTLDITLVEETIQYFFRIDPTEKSVGAVSSEFTVNVESVKNNQRYDYEYVVEDSDNIIQNITKLTGGVKIVTNGNSLDRTKSATIYFKQHRPEEEVKNVTIPFVITQETDTPSSYIFTSNLINNWNDKSINNYLGGVPVGGNAYESPTGIDIISTKNGESFDYEITQKPSWINFTKDSQNNKLNFALDAVELSSTLSQIEGKVILTQRDSGKKLEFTLIRCKGYIHVIDSPFTYDKNAHYTEDLKIISSFCVNNTGFGYTSGRPSLSSYDEHPNWISIDNSNFENAQLISTSYYYYYKVRFGIQKNEGNQRTGVVTITVGDSDIRYPIEFTQDGNPDYEYYIRETEPISEYSGPDTGQLLFENDSYTTDYYVESYKLVNGIEEPVPFRVDYARLQPEVDWCTIGEPVFVEGCKYKFTVSVKRHDAPIGVERSVNYDIIQTEGTNKSCDLTVTQGITYDLELRKFVGGKRYPDNINFNFDAEGNEKTGDDLERIFVTSLRCHFPIDYEIENNLDWVEFIFDYPNRNECRIVVSPNTGEARNGTVRIIQDDVNGEGGFKTLTYNFYQDAGEGPTPSTYTFEVNPDRHENISANGQNGLESIVTSKRGTEDINWYIEQNPQYNFITNVRKDGNKVKFDVPENTAFDSRSDSITVVQERPEGNAFIYLIVQQKARTEEFSANPDDFYLSKDGDNKTSTITSTINGDAANWTVENTPSWCNAERNGNILNISVAQNAGAERIGTITLKQTGTPNTINIQITQGGILVKFVFIRRVAGQGDYDFDPSSDALELHTNTLVESALIARVKIDDILTTNIATIDSFNFTDGDIGAITDDVLHGESAYDGYDAVRFRTNSPAYPDPGQGEYYALTGTLVVTYNGRTESFTINADWSE